MKYNQIVWQQTQQIDWARLGKPSIYTMLILYREVAAKKNKLAQV